MTTNVPVGRKNQKTMTQLDISALNLKADDNAKLKNFISQLDADGNGKLDEDEVVQAVISMLSDQQSAKRLRFYTIIVTTICFALCAVVFGLSFAATEVSKECFVKDKALKDSKGNVVASRRQEYVVKSFAKHDDSTDTITVDINQNGRRLATETRTLVGFIPCLEVTSAIERLKEGDHTVTVPLELPQGNGIVNNLNLELTAKESWSSPNQFGIADIKESSDRGGPYSVVCNVNTCHNSQTGTCKVYSGRIEHHRRLQKLQGNTEMKQDIDLLHYLHSKPEETKAERIERYMKFSAATFATIAATSAGLSGRILQPQRGSC